MCCIPCVAGLDTDDPVNREQSSDETINCKSPADVTASPVSPLESHPQRYPKDQETTRSHLNRNRTKNRVKSSSRYMFLDNSLSDEEDSVSAGVLNTFRKKNWGDHQSEETENRGSGHMVAEHSSIITQSTTCENSWTCPLTLDEFPPSDTETEESSSLQPFSQSSGQPKSPVRSNNCSGVILKLRRMFGEGLKRKKACYQAVSNTETFPDASLPQTDAEGEVTCERDLHRTTPKVTHKWQRTGNFSHALRPLSSSSKRKHSSLLKIKYCPYLSACHSAEHRRRWVLRSAVQRARRAMRFYYPDLVGKRIHHLYEEDDKSEVWYRGEVLRIHEAHSNPLKTVFEVRYDSEPEWKYYLELLIDYKKGWLKIED